MAFGDSITEGKVVTSGANLQPPCPAPSLGGGYDNTPVSYPDVLVGLLAGRYTSQTVTMKPCGLGGEPVASGRDRLAPALAAFPSQVLLLFEGANDLTGPSAVDVVANGLAAMAQYARGLGIEVFLATLTPERPGARLAAPDPTLVPQVNDRIRAIAAAQHATLVDLYLAFGGVADTQLVGPDGLHLTAQGYQVVANTFFDAIRTKLELQAGTTTALPAAVPRSRR